MNWLIFNGKLKKSADARVSVQSRPVAYGDGCFETMRSYGGYFLELDKHIDRLQSGMQYLQLEIPEQLTKSALRQQIRQLLNKNEVDAHQVAIRVQVWRSGALGYLPPQDSIPNWIMTVSSLPNTNQSIKLARVPTRRIPSASLNASYKLSNGINYIRASLEAKERGGDDALMLNSEDLVSETTISNIFWVQNSTVYTPNLECDILPGITRSIISHIVQRKTDFKLIKGKFGLPELYEAEAVWICNSLREILPVQTIGNYDFDVGHNTIKRVGEEFEDYKKNNLESLIE